MNLKILECGEFFSWRCHKCESETLVRFTENTIVHCFKCTASVGRFGERTLLNAGREWELHSLDAERLSQETDSPGPLSSP